MGHSLKFNTEAEAIEAEAAISSLMGLPKYGTSLDGTVNLRVVIERFAIPKEEGGFWFIPIPYVDGWEEELTKRGIDFTEIEITPEEPTNEP